MTNPPSHGTTTAAASGQSLAWPRGFERRCWRRARTLAALGELTALWLEGRLGYHPGYGEDGPDPETTETPELVSALAALNRAGLVTYCSQPGYEGIGHDGVRWEQRAAVEVLCSASQAMKLRTEMSARGYGVVEHAPKRRCRRRQRGVWVTRRGGKDYTKFGAQLSPADLSVVFDALLSRDAFAAVCAARQVTVYDPAWGDRSSMWPALAEAVTRPE